MKNKRLFFIILFILFFSAAGFVFPGENPWGSLKKIHFFDSTQNYSKVLETLENMDVDSVSVGEKEKIATILIKFGDRFYSKGEYENAEAFYRKVLNMSPGYWYLYNRLEKIDRDKGNNIINFEYGFSQLGMMLKDFNASFILVNGFFNMLFFTCLLVFFVFSVVLFIRYFKLAGNDFLIDEKGNLQRKKLLLVILILFWPILVLTGWMIYPFIICGFLWAYINENERRTVVLLLIMVAVSTLLYSLNLTLEKNVNADEFKTIQKVCNGHLYESDTYKTFDNDMKVIQALSYYRDKQYDTSLEILLSTGENFKSRLKYDLMGSIYFRSGDYSESIKYYHESLRIDEKNTVTLHNFTLVLLKDNNEEVFKSYAKRYPEIMEYKKDVSTLEELKISPVSNLWKRVFSSSGEDFKLGTLFKKMLSQFIELPIIYYILIFALYFFGLKRIFSVVGDSTYCSKCSKIIKEASIHKSYKLCDECYQLFLIKDVIFLEAKILKEKDLNKKYKKKYFYGLLFSLFIPGFNLNIKEKNRSFVLFLILFYFLLGFAVVGNIVYADIFLAAPIVLNLIGMLAFLAYFIVNLFSVLGDYDGF